MLEKAKEFLVKNKDRIFVIGFTLLYAIVTAILAFHHENWRDENQVWLLCKNLSIPDLLVQLKYEGHPIVWFALVYPFAQLGVSCKIVNILSWIIMVISVYLILKKAPFGKLAKLAIILTYPMMFQYVIVGRNYSLIILFVVLICLMDKSRKQHPIIYGVLLGLLANTHLIMVGFVCMITITFYLYELIINRKNNTPEENKKILKGFLVVVAAGILLLIQLVRSLTVASELPKEWDFISLIRDTILNLFNYGKALPLYSDYGRYIFNFILVVLIAVGIWEYRKQTIVFLGAIVFQCMIYSILGIMERYMAISILIIMLYTMWSAANKREIIQDKKIKKQFNYIIVMFEVMLIIISALSISNVINIYKNDYKYNYSSSKELADYINENVEQNSIMIADRDAEVSSVIPYIENGSKFWNIRTKQYYTYVTWNWDREREIEGEEVEKEIEECFKENDNLYYIHCTKRPDETKTYLEEKGMLEEVYATEQSLMDETYILYKINK